MLLAGDEFGRTQQGNNNAYCQDNPVSWLDWDLAASPEGRALTAFTARLIRLRHAHPILRCARFLYGKEELLGGLLDIAWFDEQGRGISPEAWNDPAQRTLVLRRAARTDDGTIPVLTLLLNPTEERRPFQLPPPAMKTSILIDTAMPEAPEQPLTETTVVVSAHSAVLLLATAGGKS
jgi:glycogen operon protein